jgi:hypothetical protein
VQLAVHAFLPDRQQGWRWSDVTRTSLYECSDTRQPVTRAIRYRSFAPFRAAARFEFLFVLRVGTAPADPGPTFTGAAGAWTLALPAGLGLVVPDGQQLAWRAGP